MQRKSTVENGLTVQIAEAKRLLAQFCGNVEPNILTGLEADIRAAFRRAAERASRQSEAPERFSPSLSPAAVSGLWGREQFRSRQDKTESPVAFLRRVYGDVLGQGLVKADLRRRHPDTKQKVDHNLYQALANWATKHGLPDDLDFPTRSEAKAKPDPHSAAALIAG